jgi:ligand-binding SRPBCC domain-containing protein
VRVLILDREQLVRRTPHETFEFFQDAHNLEALTPSFLAFRVITPRPIAMGEGALIDYRLRLHGVPVRWRTRIAVWEPDRRFVDEQLQGPYALWHHTHTFEPHDEGTLMRDRVRYRLPLGLAGAVAHLAFVRSDLERIFDFRRDEVARRLG